MHIADLNNTGTGNQLVQTIGCNANLAKVALRIGLDHYIITAQDIVPPQSLLATTMEAVLGAIDCDSGENAVPSAGSTGRRCEPCATSRGFRSSS